MAQLIKEGWNMGKNEKMNDELLKVNDDEMDNVAGGAFFFASSEE